LPFPRHHDARRGGLPPAPARASSSTEAVRPRPKPVSSRVALLSDGVQQAGAEAERMTTHPGKRFI
jgi:hypothetical protein